MLKSGNFGVYILAKWNITSNSARKCECVEIKWCESERKRARSVKINSKEAVMCEQKAKTATATQIIWVFEIKCRDIRKMREPERKIERLQTSWGEGEERQRQNKRIKGMEGRILCDSIRIKCQYVC